MAAGNAPMVGDRIMSGALRFIREQPMAVTGSRDAQGRLWASMIFGRPGFLDPDPGRKALTIHVQPELRDEHDPLWTNIKYDPGIGLLVIDLGTRRRLRINGHLSSSEGETLRVEVEESFANCPKYIQRRDVQVSSLPADTESPGAERRDSKFGPQEEELLRRADTFFVASAHPERGLDASHRGGNPGFVEIMDETTLRIPDYAGNSMFNTIGNFLVDPRAGLVVPDFKRCKLIQMTGRVNVQWKEPANDDTGRSWIFHLDELRRRSMPAALHTHFIDYSPYNPPSR
jgi:hypothetical protein